MMNRSQELFEEIESYLNSTLSSEAKVAFEDRMESDAALRQEVALHASVHKELGTAHELEFRDLLNRIGAAQQTKRKKKSFPWKIAASVAILVAASTYFYVQSLSDSSLFETYYSPYPVEDQLRGANDDKRENALKLYANGDYEKAAKALQLLLELNPKDAQFNLYYGNCLLNQQKVEQARRIFESFTTDSSGYEAGQWYLALSYLKNENLDASKAVLKNLVAYDGIYKEKALKLLKVI